MDKTLMLTTIFFISGSVFAAQQDSMVSQNVNKTLQNNDTTNISEQKLKVLVTSIKDASGNPTGFIEKSQTLFQKGFKLPAGYKEILSSYLSKKADSLEFYSLFRIQNKGASGYVDLIVNSNDSTVFDLNSLYKWYAPYRP